MYEGGLYITDHGFVFDVFDCDMGYHLSLFNSDFEEMDGGLLETDDWEEENFVVTEGLAVCGCINTQWWEVNHTFQSYSGDLRNWTDFFEEQPKFASFYIRSYVSGLSYEEAERYIHIFKFSGRDIGIDIFRQISSYMYERDLDILQAEKGNEEWKVIMRFLRKCKLDGLL